MTQRIIYTNEEGGVSVVVPAPNTGLSVQEVAEKDCPAGSDYEIVDTATVPSDRTFRSAWRKEAGKVDIDLTAAKSIAHNHRRAKRSEEYLVVDANNENVVVTPAAQLQRDAIKTKYDRVQVDLDAATTVEALKAQMVSDGLV